MRSSFGYVAVAIRESQEAASSLGIDITKYKILAFMLSSFMSGVAGAFYAHYILILTPDIMGLHTMVSILVMGMLGGLGTLHQTHSRNLCLDLPLGISSRFRAVSLHHLRGTDHFFGPIHPRRPCHCHPVETRIKELSLRHVTSDHPRIRYTEPAGLQTPAARAAIVQAGAALQNALK